MRTILYFIGFIAFIFIFGTIIKHLADKYKVIKYIIIATVIVIVCVCYHIYGGQKDPLYRPQDNPYFKCEYDSNHKTK